MESNDPGERMREALAEATTIVDDYNDDVDGHQLDEDHILGIAETLFHARDGSMEEMLDGLEEMFPGDDRDTDDFRVG